MTGCESSESAKEPVAWPGTGGGSGNRSCLAAWIWSCAYLNFAGWILSAIGQLNAKGYIVVLVTGGLAFFAGNAVGPAEAAAKFQRRFKTFRHRFQRPLPFAFLILSAMAFLGGAIYAPTNYDALAYRLPRVLHWLAAGQWHWIHADFDRVNDRACGIEWVSAPWIAIFKTDRFLFLINVVSFLFLPGLAFSVLTRLGVRARAAWHWMWIAPTGYCFLLQAGSIANDAFSAPFALAAIDFALRAKSSKSARCFFSSILAAALMTGAKASNLPLLLPWAIAIVPALKILVRRPVASAAICVLAASASFIPSAILNQRFCHDWSGASLEGHQAPGSLAIRFGANIVLVTSENVVPPIFPQAARWNELVRRVIPPHLSQELHQTMAESPAAEFRLETMQIEEDAGFGFGPTLLVLASIIAVAFSRKNPFFGRHASDGLWKAGVVAAPWIATFALLTQSGITQIARVMAPYYILLLPLVLRSPCQEQMVRKLWWRGAAFLVFVPAAVLLIVSPARPLFPRDVLLAKIDSGRSHSKLGARIDEVYTVYRDRNHAFAPALAILPPGTEVLGLITYDDPEAALWRPFGSRQIVCLRPGDTASYLKSRGVRFILARSALFGTQFPNFDDWAKKMNARLVRKLQLNLRAAAGSSEWYLIELK